MEDKIDALYGLVQQIAVELKQTRGELKDTREELTGQIAGVRQELQQQITGVRVELNDTKDKLTGQIVSVREELQDTRRELAERLDRVERRLNATFDQVGMLSEFRVEVLHKFEELTDHISSIYEIIGEHDVKIRALWRRKRLQGFAMRRAF
ncbi:MAG: hypothetical protein PWQ18_1133 [Clostridia bacterium]|nr:hypothetical protein [Clostridia bacterium]